MNNVKQIKQMQEYLEQLKQLEKTNPVLAKSIAKKNLQESGILDGNCNISALYLENSSYGWNFSRGPARIYTKRRNHSGRK